MKKIRYLNPAGLSPGLGWAMGVSLVLSLFLPLTANAAGDTVRATATFDKALGKIVVKGSAVAKYLPSGSWVQIYNADNNILLYTAKTDGSKAFSTTLQSGADACNLRLETLGGNKTTVPVYGADAACKAAPVCSISSPVSNPQIIAGQSLKFQASGSGKGVSYTWNLGNGQDEVAGQGITPVFDQTGQFRVVLQGLASNGQRCSDDVIVMVKPPANANPNPKVRESSMPLAGNALKAKDGAWVVLPFEETGMQGGSMVNLPFNPMVPYDALNAQLIKKVKGKPEFGRPDQFSVFYSAASNKKDPVGGDSINSTSQNLFADGEIGANYDPLSSLFDPVKQIPTDNKFVEGHDFRDAVIRKNELWDRQHQPYAKDIDKIAETGRSFADTQSTYTPAKPIPLPDQSIRGSADDGANVRQMPGIKNPYRANDPQPLDAFDDSQQKFIAQFIPVSDVDDKGRVNPYPLMRVEAVDKNSKKVIAKTDAVYTTASETRCRECHAKGKIAGDENVWRTPVTESELVNADGTPGPATGAGSFPPGSDPAKPWPPAIHNRFDDKHPDNPAFTNLASGANDPASPAYIPRDANGLRTDRIAESRIGPDGKLQVRLKFREPESDSWVDQEKAALFNTLIMHDYMVLYGPTPATANQVGADGKPVLGADGKPLAKVDASGKPVYMNWPASYSSQLTDYYGDDIGKNRSQPMYFCSGHHYSHLKIDNGVGNRAYPTNRSDYSRAFHAFHGKLQVYKRDVTARESADGLAHQQGDLIRDERGHPKMFGGRGWDSQHNDNLGVPLKQDPATGAFTVKSSYTWDPLKNDWAPALFPMDKNGELMLPFGEGVAMEENCTKCHTGPTEKSYRDIHHASGLQCDNCHGDMLAVGNAYENKQYDANLTGGGVYGGESVHFRRPWLDEPDCGSCHVGDGNKKDEKKGFFSAGVKKVAWDAKDPAKASVFPEEARFAVMPTVEMRKEKGTVTGADGVSKTAYLEQPVSQALYRKSKDVHGSGPNGELACSACHGGSHSIWPNPDPNANDNVTAKQLQGYDGNIAECSVCHVKDDFKGGMVATNGGTRNLGVGQGVRDGTVVNASSPKAYLAGPHGMHPVNDPYWWKQADLASGKKGGWHSDFTKKPGPDGEDQCAACHGSDHKGTRLSKALTDRSFVDENNKPVKVAANTPIGCDLCHSLEKSFEGSPKGTPKPHAPPAPAAIVATGGTGGGGHH